MVWKLIIAIKSDTPSDLGIYIMGGDYEYPLVAADLDGSNFELQFPLLDDDDIMESKRIIKNVAKALKNGTLTKCDNSFMNMEIRFYEG